MINTKHLDTDPTSAALREVDGASKARGETLRGKEEESEGKQSGKRGEEKREQRTGACKTDANLLTMR